MNSEVIKQFLVSLGFGVDDQSLDKFNKSILSASKRVTALYASIKVLAAGIFAGIAKISEGFEEMGYQYRIIAPAINKELILRRELLKAYAAAGISIVQVIQQSVKFNMSLAKTKFAFQAIYSSVAAKFFPMLTKQMDIFRKNIYANMPKIQQSLEKFVNFVFKAFEMTTALGMRIWGILQRVYDFFYRLHQQTQGWSTYILAAIAAWKLLNLTFLATPLGMILSGLLAIIALWDDFQVWKEGGKSLFDWAPFVPVINSVSNALESLYEVVDQIFTVIFNLGDLLYKVFTGDFSGAWDRLKETLSEVLELIDRIGAHIVNLFGAVGSVGKWVGGLGDTLSGLFKGGGAQTAQNIGSAQGGAQLGSSVQNSQTNQNVQQQTNIQVQGTADANSIGKAVASEQNRVNFDFVRNLKGATR